MIRPTLLLAALLSITPVMAHEGHDHDEESLTEGEVKQLAAKTLPALIQAKKVAPSWSKAQPADVIIRPAAGKDIWVVTYKSAANPAEKPLYLIFDDLGNFVEANQTGKVAGE